jgi:hypothetical protein
MDGMFCRLWLWSMIACIPACSIIYPAPTPIPSISYPAKQDVPSRALLVLLPGRHDTAADFQKHGFVRVARESGAPVDLVAADAQYGYYIARTLGQRLAEDVFAPARARGYRSFWISGISMGGLGLFQIGRQTNALIFYCLGYNARYLGGAVCLEMGAVEPEGCAAARAEFEAVVQSNRERQSGR